MDDHIQFTRVRPRIKVKTHYNTLELTEIIRKELGSDACPCEGQTVQGFATICPPKEQQHFWSPQLTITFEQEEDGTLIRGLYGPRPSVWTMFVFFYLFIAFAAVIVLMIGLSLRTIGQPSAILWLVPVFILLFLSLYLVAYFGQRLGQKQMTALHRFLERCIGAPIEAD